MLLLWKRCLFFLTGSCQLDSLLLFQWLWCFCLASMSLLFIFFIFLNVLLGCNLKFGSYVQGNTSSTLFQIWPRDWCKPGLVLASPLRFHFWYCSFFVLTKHAIRLVKILMILLFVIAWPISKMLDSLLGESHLTIYGRSRKYRCCSLSESV